MHMFSISGTEWVAQVGHGGPEQGIYNGACGQRFPLNHFCYWFRTALPSYLCDVNRNRYGGLFPV